MKHSLNQLANRIVIIGANGVIGKALISVLEGVETLPLTRNDIDLLGEDAFLLLCERLMPTDVVIMLATITPDKGRGIDALQQNIQMMKVVCQAINKQGAAHLIYLSSDAVYSYEHPIINETTPADPVDLFGAMHRVRELMAESCLGIPVTILRSTLIYALNDTHNSYGPNRMRRSAIQQGVIKLFGQGEDRRDHISVRDVAALICLTILKKCTGIFNLASGKSISYGELAKMIASQLEAPIVIETSSRQTPVTYRHFDLTKLYKTFPDFVFEDLESGIKEIHQLEKIKVK